MAAQKREAGKNYIGLLNDEIEEPRAADLPSAADRRIKQYVLGLMAAMFTRRRGEARWYPSSRSGRSERVSAKKFRPGNWFPACDAAVTKPAIRNGQAPQAAKRISALPLGSAARALPNGKILFQLSSIGWTKPACIQGERPS